MADEKQKSLAVVTGASSGIGGEIVPMPQDLTADGAAERVAARAAGLGGAELLVSNAGFGSYGPFWKTSHDRTMQMLRLNVLAGTDLAHRLLSRSSLPYNADPDRGFACGASCAGRCRQR